MMTSVATVAGHFPLTLVTGAGAAARNSIGLVLVGGMTIGTIFTLFIVPSLYMLIAKEHHEKSLAGREEEPARKSSSRRRTRWHARERQRLETSLSFLPHRSGQTRTDQFRFCFGQTLNIKMNERIEVHICRSLRFL